MAFSPEGILFWNMCYDGALNQVPTKKTDCEDTSKSEAPFIPRKKLRLSRYIRVVPKIKVPSAPNTRCRKKNYGPIISRTTHIWAHTILEATPSILKVRAGVSGGLGLGFLQTPLPKKLGSTVIAMFFSMIRATPTIMGYIWSYR